MTAVVSTPERHGYAVKWCPHRPDSLYGQRQRLACAASQHFGIAGKGSLFVVDVHSERIRLPYELHWPFGLYGVAWSEQNEAVLATCSADSSIQIWNLAAPDFPVRLLKEHTAEVHGIDWNVNNNHPLLLSASWDKTVKVWDSSRTKALATYHGHSHYVYSALWSPLIAGCFASTSGDHTLRIWDVKSPPSSAQVCLSVHNAEVLTCGWSYYNQNLIFTGSTDNLIRSFDVRKPTQAVFVLRGHEYAVKRLKCSPFDGNILASCSYDFTVRFWDFSVCGTPIETVQHHREFVCDIDFNLHQSGQIADCSWDSTIKIYNPEILCR